MKKVKFKNRAFYEKFRHLYIDNTHSNGNQ